MATELKRMTFAVPQELEVLLKCVKKEIFYDRSQSEMIRELISVGLSVQKSRKQLANDECIGQF